MMHLASCCSWSHSDLSTWCLASQGYMMAHSCISTSKSTHSTVLPPSSSPLPPQYTTIVYVFSLFFSPKIIPWIDTTKLTTTWNIYVFSFFLFSVFAFKLRGKMNFGAITHYGNIWISNLWNRKKSIGKKGKLGNKRNAFLESQIFDVINFCCAPGAAGHISLQLDTI